MAAALRSRTLDETRGFMKVLIAPDDQILGFTAIGPGTGELLPVIQLAMTAKMPYSAVHNLSLTHPTLSEGFLNLFNSVPKL